MTLLCLHKANPQEYQCTAKSNLLSWGRASAVFPKCGVWTPPTNTFFHNYSSPWLYWRSQSHKRCIYILHTKRKSLLVYNSSQDKQPCKAELFRAAFSLVGFLPDDTFGKLRQGLALEVRSSGYIFYEGLHGRVICTRYKLETMGSPTFFFFISNAVYV